jgi:DNA polymerase III epsilon subunit-like protein
MYVTIIDTETTGLLEAEGVDISLQPHITEIYAMQIDEAGSIIKEIDTLVKPPIPIPALITKITGIDDNKVRNAPSFSQIYKELIEVFFCSHTMVAHNLSFDEGMLITELKRMGKEFHFPYCPIKYCTVEQSMHIKGHRLKNTELYNIATGKEIVGAHRAKVDVQATYESYKWLMAGGGR